MTAPLLVFPDVELWATAYLRAALGARPEAYASQVYVSNAVPTTRQPRMVIVRRDGGPMLDRWREAARLTVRVWGGTEREATDLARLVAALLWVSADGNPVLRVTQPTGTTPVADDSKQPLRLLAFELTVRGTPMEGA
jgi:hypothetical protein